MDFDDFAFQQQPPAPAEAPPRAAPERAGPPLPPLQQGPALRPLSHAKPSRAPVAARARAGLGVLAAAAGAGLGGILGGPWGMAAGLTGVGALRNLYRTQGIASSDPSEQSDAARSAALALVGGAIAVYLGYKAFSTKESR